MYFIRLTNTDGKKASGAQSLHTGSKTNIKLQAKYRLETAGLTLI